MYFKNNSLITQPLPMCILCIRTVELRNQWTQQRSVDYRHSLDSRLSLCWWRPVTGITEFYVRRVERPQHGHSGLEYWNTILYIDASSSNMSAIDDDVESPVQCRYRTPPNITQPSPASTLHASVDVTALCSSLHSIQSTLLFHLLQHVMM